jgi:hypothetical protein
MRVDGEQFAKHPHSGRVAPLVRCRSTLHGFPHAKLVADDIGQGWYMYAIGRQSMSTFA